MFTLTYKGNPVTFANKAELDAWLATKVADHKARVAALIDDHITYTIEDDIVDREAFYSAKRINPAIYSRPGVGKSE